MRSTAFWLVLLGACLLTAGKADGAETEKSDPRPQLLETVGALTAANLYQAYLNIGFLADGRSRGDYQAKDAQQLLKSVLSLLDTVDGHLDKVGKLDLERDDRDTLARMRQLSTLLRQQGKALQTYWETGDQEDLLRFHGLRDQSWIGVRKLLGLSG